MEITVVSEGRPRFQLLKQETAALPLQFWVSGPKLSKLAQIGSVYVRESRRGKLQIVGALRSGGIISVEFRSVRHMTRPIRAGLNYNATQK